MALFAIAIAVEPAHGTEPLPPTLALVLTQLDEMPTKQQIVGATAAEPVSVLGSLANDSTKDFGVRLRAIRSLPLFCATSACKTGDPAYDALVRALDVQEPHAGRRVLLLRAVVEALGATSTADPDAVSLLAPHLDHGSRDVRATTAHALRTICDTAAVPRLRRRYEVEQVAQVRLAISNALRDLSQCRP